MTVTKLPRLIHRILTIHLQRLPIFLYYRLMSSLPRILRYGVLADSYFACMHNGVFAQSMCTTQRLAESKPTIDGVYSGNWQWLHAASTCLAGCFLYGILQDLMSYYRVLAEFFATASVTSSLLFERPYRDNITELFQVSLKKDVARIARGLPGGKFWLRRRNTNWNFCDLICGAPREVWVHYFPLSAYGQKSKMTLLNCYRLMGRNSVLYANFCSWELMATLTITRDICKHLSAVGLACIFPITKTFLKLRKGVCKTVSSTCRTYSTNWCVGTIWRIAIVQKHFTDYRTVR